MEKLIDLVGLNIFKEQVKNKFNLSYDTSTKRINMRFGQEILSFIDAAPFIIDGMLNDVTIATANAQGVQGTYIKFDFNTDSGKSTIYVDAGDILKDIPQRITELETNITTKVDKVEGKGLSANDFTDSYKAMLDNVATEADIISLFA